MKQYIYKYKRRTAEDFFNLISAMVPFKLKCCPPGQLQVIPWSFFNPLLWSYHVVILNSLNITRLSWYEIWLSAHDYFRQQSVKDEVPRRQRGTSKCIKCEYHISDKKHFLVITAKKHQHMLPYITSSLTSFSPSLPLFLFLVLSFSFSLSVF